MHAWLVRQLAPLIIHTVLIVVRCRRQACAQRSKTAAALDRSAFVSPRSAAFTLLRVCGGVCGNRVYDPHGDAPVERAPEPQAQPSAPRAQRRTEPPAFGRSANRDPCRRRARSWRDRSRCRPKDRKSTRLNSSHGSISYAVFCLKKKKKTKNPLNDKNQKQTKKSTKKKTQIN